MMMLIGFPLFILFVLAIQPSSNAYHQFPAPGTLDDKTVVGLRFRDGQRYVTACWGCLGNPSIPRTFVSHDQGMLSSWDQYSMDINDAKQRETRIRCLQDNAVFKITKNFVDNTGKTHTDKYVIETQSMSDPVTNSNIFEYTMSFNTGRFKFCSIRTDLGSGGGYNTGDEWCLAYCNNDVCPWTMGSSHLPLSPIILLMRNPPTNQSYWDLDVVSLPSV